MAMRASGSALIFAVGVLVASSGQALTTEDSSSTESAATLESGSREESGKVDCGCRPEANDEASTSRTTVEVYDYSEALGIPDYSKNPDLSESIGHE